MSSSSVVRQTQGPLSKEADDFFEKELAGLFARLDATDTLYALGSSRDYDPGPGLEKILAPLLANAVCKFHAARASSCIGW